MQTIQKGGGWTARDFEFHGRTILLFGSRVKVVGSHLVRQWSPHLCICIFILGCYAYISCRYIHSTGRHLPQDLKHRSVLTHKHFETGPDR